MRIISSTHPRVASSALWMYFRMAWASKVWARCAGCGFQEKMKRLPSFSAQALTSAQGPPPDQAAREKIRSALDANLLVEAGAGSGKTTSLVDRLMAYVARGEAVDGLAAVTFTRRLGMPGEMRIG